MSSTDSWAVSSTLLASSTLTIMAVITISPALPKMALHFAATPDAAFLVRLLLTAPSLTFAVSAPFLGQLSDRIGRKPVMIYSLVLFAVAGGGGLWLDSIHWLVASRALLGVGAAGVFPTATALIADYYHETVRPRFLGMQSAAISAAGVAYLVLGGFLADWTWRAPFGVYLVVLLLVPCVHFFLVETTQNSSSAKDGELGPTRTSRVRIRWTKVVKVYGIAALVQISFFLIPVQLPFHLAELADAGPSTTGLVMSAFNIASFFSALAFRALARAGGVRLVYGLAFALIAVGYTGMGLAQGLALAVVGLAFAGMGVGLVMPNLSLHVTSIAPPAFRGRLLSGLMSCIFMGQFLSPVAAGFVIRPWGYGASFVGAGMTMALLLGLLLVRRPPRVR